MSCASVTRFKNVKSSTHFDSDGTTLVFSVDKVFSCNVVERRGIMPPPLGPTVRLPLAGSYLDVVRGLAGLEAAERIIGNLLMIN